MGECVAVLGRVVSVDLQGVLPFHVRREGCLDDKVLTFASLRHILLQQGVIFPRTRQLAQDAHFTGLREADLRFPPDGDDDGLSVAWREAVLLDGRARTPIGIGGDGIRHCIVSGSIRDDLVLASGFEDGLHIQFIADFLRVDGKVVGSLSRRADVEVHHVVQSLLKDVTFQLGVSVFFLVILAIDQFEGEGRGLGVSKRHVEAAILHVDDAPVLVEELHAALEEEGLGKWEILKLGEGERASEQLPTFLLRPMAVDQLLGLRHKVEIIVLIHQVLRYILL